MALFRIEKVILRNKILFKIRLNQETLDIEKKASTFVCRYLSFQEGCTNLANFIFVMFVISRTRFI